MTEPASPHNPVESPAAAGTTPERISRLMRLAVFCTLAGLICVLLFLWVGFNAWSVGLGIFLGIPLLIAGMLLYVGGVLRDLHRRGVL
jgi:hypothetical protein